MSSPSSIGREVQRDARLAQQVIIVLIPPLALIFLVLGTIFLGIATSTRQVRDTVNALSCCHKAS